MLMERSQVTEISRNSGDPEVVIRDSFGDSFLVVGMKLEVTRFDGGATDEEPMVTFTLFGTKLNRDGTRSARKVYNQAVHGPIEVVSIARRSAS